MNDIGKWSVSVKAFSNMVVHAIIFVQYCPIRTNSFFVLGTRLIPIFLGTHWSGQTQLLSAIGYMTQTSNHLMISIFTGSLIGGFSLLLFSILSLWSNMICFLWEQLQRGILIMFVVVHLKTFLTSSTQKPMPQHSPHSNILQWWPIKYYLSPKIHASNMLVDTWALIFMLFNVRFSGRRVTILHIYLWFILFVMEFEPRKCGN